MKFAKTITQLRDQAGLSQQDVAKHLGIARATYASLEANRRDPNLSEITAISELYQIAPAMLIESYADHVAEPTPSYSANGRPSPQKPNYVQPKYNPKKLREVLLYVLGKVGALPYMGESNLGKLLYFIDFDYFVKHQTSITGLAYIRNHFGATPSIEFTELIKTLQSNNELDIAETPNFNHLQRKLLPIVNPELKLLTADELDHINQEINRLADKTSSELSALFYINAPWQNAKDGQIITYLNPKSS